MATFLAFPTITLLLMIQMAIVSRLPLLHGTADLLMLTIIAWGMQERVKNSWLWAAFAGLLVSFVSALPFFVPLISLLAINGLTRLLRRRVWQTPILAMFVMTFIGTFFQHFLSLIALRFSGTIIPIGTSLSQVTFPSVLLNLILALPVYAVISDLANSVYPLEVEI
jgi:hypothetical protein